MRQQQQNDSGFQSRDAFNLMLVICQSLAVTCEAFLHRRPGRRWPGVHGVLGCGLILLFTLLWPRENPAPLVFFLFMYLGACVRHRVDMLRAKHDYATHSSYSGTPCVARVFRSMSEITIKRVVEPALVFLTGLIVIQLNKPLGSYLMFAAWGLFISVNIAVARLRQRVQDLKDSVNEQKQIAAMFRDSSLN